MRTSSPLRNVPSASSHHVDQQQPEHDPERRRRRHPRNGAREARAVRNQRQRNLVRVGHLDRRLLRGLLDALEHRLQQPARCLRVAQHRVQRDLCLRVARGLRLLLAQVALQRNHALPTRAHIGVDGGNDPTDLRGNGAVHIGKLCAKRA